MQQKSRQTVIEVNFYNVYNGMGIDSTIAAGLFRFGSKSSRRRTNNETRPGLGLTLSKELIKNDRALI